jgi:thymidine kinase
MLKRTKFTLLIGPANSGKTCHFIFHNFYAASKKLIISAVTFDKLFDVNSYPHAEEKLKQGEVCFLNVNETSPQELLTWKSFPLFVLIDEIHLFTDRQLQEVLKVLRKVPSHNLFITMIPGSYTQDPLPNTHYLLACANSGNFIHGKCGHHAQTLRSGIRIEQPSDKRQIIIGKKNFDAVCFDCHIKQQQQPLAKS